MIREICSGGQVFFTQCRLHISLTAQTNKRNKEEQKAILKKREPFDLEDQLIWAFNHLLESL